MTAILFWLTFPAFADESMPLLYSRTQITITRAGLPPPEPLPLPWQAGENPAVPFEVEVRDATSFYQQEGWFNLSSPSEKTGVLLVFAAPSVAPITPASHYAPLDILMIDQEGDITQILPNLKLAELEEEIYPKDPVLAFLFLKGGICEALSIKPGDVVTYALFKRPPTVLEAKPPAPPVNPLPTVKRREEKKESP